MRTKQSFTASEMYRSFEPFTAPVPLRTAATGLTDAGAFYAVPPPRRGASAAPPLRSRSRPGQRAALDAGLLHDARNLMGAIELYCDLLSMPGVLQPEHQHYAEDLRLLGSRSGALIQRLIEHRLQPSPTHNGLLSRGHSMETSFGERRAASKKAADCIVEVGERGAGAVPVGTLHEAPGPVGLRAVVERCAGLLGRVACGRRVEVSYGPSASVPLAVGEEAVERILVNLVRNAATALGGASAQGPGGIAQGAVVERSADRTADETPGAVRIGVGLAVNRADDPRPWPLRRVRLTVEDSGCGMTAQQLERILSGNRAPSRGGHGIGFRIVRELVADSGGDLRVMSAPGVGTRVQIEWPVAACIRSGPCERPAVEGTGSIC